MVKGSKKRTGGSTCAGRHGSQNCAGPGGAKSHRTQNRRRGTVREGKGALFTIGGQGQHLVNGTRGGLPAGHPISPCE